MTADDALDQARERWPGLGAWVRVTANPRAPYQVGITRAEGRVFRRVMVGCGLTWERAFMSADKHAHRALANRITRRAVARSNFAQGELFAHGSAPDAMVRG